MYVTCVHLCMFWGCAYMFVCVSVHMSIRGYVRVCVCLCLVFASVRECTREFVRSCACVSIRANVNGETVGHRVHLVYICNACCEL